MIIMGWDAHLIVAVVGVPHDGQDVPDGEDDGGQPGSPESNIYLMGEEMVFQHQPALGSLLRSWLGHRDLCRLRSASANIFQHLLQIGTAHTDKVQPGKRVWGKG